MYILAVIVIRLDEMVGEWKYLITKFLVKNNYPTQSLLSSLLGLVHLMHPR